MPEATSEVLIFVCYVPQNYLYIYSCFPLITQCEYKKYYSVIYFLLYAVSLRSSGVNI